MPPFWRRHSKSPSGLQGDRVENQQSTRDSFQSIQPQELSATSPTPAAAPVPENPFAKSGDDHFRNGEYIGAVFMFNEAVKLEPRNPLLHRKLCLARSLSSPPQLEEALNDINNAIQLQPASGHAWKLKGDICLRQGDLEEAEEALLNAVGNLQDMDLVSAQQSLADVRSRKLAAQTASPSVSASTSPPLINIASPSIAPTEPAVSDSAPTPPIKPASPPRTLPTASVSANPPTQLPHRPAPTSPNSSPRTDTSTPEPAVQAPTSTGATQAPAHISTPVANSTGTRIATTATTATPVAPATSSPPPAPPALPANASTMASTFASSLVPTSSPPGRSPPATRPRHASTTQTSQTTASTTGATRNNQTSPSLTSPVGLVAPTNPSTQRTPTPIQHSANLEAQDIALGELPIPSEPPPTYTPSPYIPATLGAGAIADSFDAQITALENGLKLRQQGGLYLLPYTQVGQIDSVQLHFYGKAYLDSVLVDIGPEPQTHFTFKSYWVNAITFPGSTFLDFDCETARSHEGQHLGTTSVLGYTEEYRVYQLGLAPLLNLTLEAHSIPPVMGVQTIVERIQALQRSPQFEDNVRLAQSLGLASSTYIVRPDRQTQIEDICMMFNRGQYASPGRFVDFTKEVDFSSSMFGQAGGIGLTNFLFHILLGAELLIRLRKEPRTVSYQTLMTHATSAMIVIAAMWMENVTIRAIPSPGATLGASLNRYSLIAHNHQRQTEGLIRFAEILAWPYLDETRREIQGLYNKLIPNPASVGNHLKDWLYGLVLPGKIFRHRIMACLVDSTPSVKAIGPAKWFENGLVVSNKSYWPKRTVLGGVLGGLRNPKCTCGWVGPVPAPVDTSTGWIKLSARDIPCPTPVSSTTQDALADLGVNQADLVSNPVNTVNELCDLTKWKPPSGLPTAYPNLDLTNPQSSIRFERIRLTEVAQSGITGTGSKLHQAHLVFMIHGIRTSFTMYTNPIFVHVPKCQGNTHPIHERQVRRYYNNTIPAAELKTRNRLPDAGELMIIDATQAGSDIVARAWCAERGRHAVVRKGGIGCFTCATNLAAARTGLGFNVLIWCD